MFLILDTETNGKPVNYYAPVDDVDNWPRVVQLAWMLCDGDGRELQIENRIIQPDGWTIPEDASRVHGITTERAAEMGIPIASAVELLLPILANLQGFVAHNLSFDLNVMGAELIRLGHINLLDQPPKFCTMIYGTDLCKIPGRRGYKWPRLNELHRFLFSDDAADQHDALGDVRSCKRCFFEMRSRGVFKTPQAVA